MRHARLLVRVGVAGLAALPLTAAATTVAHADDATTADERGTDELSGATAPDPGQDTFRAEDLVAGVLAPADAAAADGPVEGAVTVMVARDEAPEADRDAVAAGPPTTPGVTTGSDAAGSPLTEAADHGHSPDGDPDDQPVAGNPGEPGPGQSQAPGATAARNPVPDTGGRHAMRSAPDADADTSSASASRTGVRGTGTSDVGTGTGTGTTNGTDTGTDIGTANGTGMGTGTGTGTSTDTADGPDTDTDTGTDTDTDTDTDTGTGTNTSGTSGAGAQGTGRKDAAGDVPSRVGATGRAETHRAEPERPRGPLTALVDGLVGPTGLLGGNGLIAGLVGGLFDGPLVAVDAEVSPQVQVGGILSDGPVTQSTARTDQR